MPKVWFITGSSRGLGRSLTEAVLAAGDKVVATARKPEQLEAIAILEKANASRDAELAKWKPVSLSTDAEDGDTAKFLSTEFGKSFK